MNDIVPVVSEGILLYRSWFDIFSRRPGFNQIGEATFIYYPVNRLQYFGESRMVKTKIQRNVLYFNRLVRNYDADGNDAWAKDLNITFKAFQACFGSIEHKIQTIDGGFRNLIVLQPLPRMPSYFAENVIDPVTMNILAVIPAMGGILFT